MFLSLTLSPHSILLLIFFLSNGFVTALQNKDSRFESTDMIFRSNLRPRPIISCKFNTLHAVHETRHYVYFPGKPRWTRGIPMVLTYAFFTDTWICNLSLKQAKTVFQKAFSKWSSVIPVSFNQSNDYGFSDIKIRFYSGDHGDGEPFDGVLGVLAHSFSPESGRLHLDAAETWAVDFESEKSTVAIDLESVATHEIGHLLGLGHSWVKESVMYPSLKAREKKANLEEDDIEGVQGLYGSNPNFKMESMELEFDTSVSERSSVCLRIETWAAFIFLLLLHASLDCFST